ncbi:hypothetical protein SODALDRAFT_69106 [Sodiomyces alkalinus F11]|uniref:Uncharacterized protein n=1 Tax=Sodiomyces alkalinus (strain CBS 110278 / VKM F-3762 / F11) TaxID=1314773 RepID=A0A3N2PLY0_SODAK|nr:hypothetical protein SODALDRAFT_69106 [Sodiomyces alkalinus F11]ROT35533.1 hypothetical protein SODALDRAFT_69106 [Sodiomyces alkalinus F11]
MSSYVRHLVAFPNQASRPQQQQIVLHDTLITRPIFHIPPCWIRTFFSFHIFPRGLSNGGIWLSQCQRFLFSPSRCSYYIRPETGCKREINISDRHFLCGRKSGGSRLGGFRRERSIPGCLLLLFFLLFFALFSFVP